MHMHFKPHPELTSPINRSDIHSTKLAKNWTHWSRNDIFFLKVILQTAKLYNHGSLIKTDSSSTVKKKCNFQRFFATVSHTNWRYCFSRGFSRKFILYVHVGMKISDIFPGSIRRYFSDTIFHAEKGPWTGFPALGQRRCPYRVPPHDRGVNICGSMPLQLTFLHGSDRLAKNPDRAPSPPLPPPPPQVRYNLKVA